MKNKKKLFFLLYSMNVGGVEKSLLGLLSTLPIEENDIHIGLLQRRGGYLDQLPQGVTIHDCFVGCWDIVNNPPLASIKRILGEWRILEGLMHLIVYIWYKISGNLSLFYKLVLRNDPPIDIEFDEAFAYAGPSSMIDYYICNKIKAKHKYGWIHFDVKQNGIDQVITRKQYPKFDKIYIVSETGKQRFDELFPEFANKTDVRYNIVSREQVLSLAEKGNSFEDDFEGKRILTVGRLSKEKGQDVAIEALKILIDKGYNIHWYFIGDGDLRAACEEKANSLGISNYVSFLGTITNPYGYMRDCDIYMQPSRHEGYCITLAEARCFSAPIVATNFTGAEEQLKTYPNSVVTGMGVEEIASGIITLL